MRDTDGASGAPGDPGETTRPGNRTGSPAGGSGSGPGGDVVIDCQGQRCPLPVIMLARQLPRVPAGTVLRVLADDPAAAVDIPAWCRMRGQEYVGSEPEGTATAHRVRRLS